MKQTHLPLLLTFRPDLNIILIICKINLHKTVKNIYSFEFLNNINSYI